MEAASIVCLPLFFAFRVDEKKPKDTFVLRLRSPGIAMTRHARMSVQRLQRDIMFMLTLCITHTVPNTRNIAASTV